MKNDFTDMLRSLQNELTHLDDEHMLIRNNFTKTNLARAIKARGCLATLMPDLSMNTVEKLGSQVPGFYIQTVSGWFGFNKRVAPQLSLDSLRISLGIYLDNMRSGTPWIWQETILPLDKQILDLQQSVRLTAEKKVELQQRIAAVEKLLAIDETKLAPELRVKLAKAAAEQVKLVQLRPANGTSVNSPHTTLQPTEVNSNSGPSLLEIWLWWQLLTPHSDYNVGFPSVGPYDHLATNHQHDVSDAGMISTGAIPETAATSDNSHHPAHSAGRDLAHHEALGSQSYS